MFQRVVRFGLVGAVVVSLVVFSGCGVNGPQGVRKVGDSSGGVDLDELMSRQKTIKSYTMITTFADDTYSMSFKMNDGTPVRMKMDMGSQGMTLKQMDNKVQYTYDPATRIAMKSVMSDKEIMDSEPAGMPELPKVLKIGAMKKPVLKSDKVDGIDCWRIDSKGGTGQDVQIWIDKNYGLPIQAKLDNMTIKHTYKNINSVPDSEFELPAGAIVHDMDAMMKNIPNMQNMPKPGN